MKKVIIKSDNDNGSKIKRTSSVRYTKPFNYSRSFSLPKFYLFKLYICEITV